MHLLERLRVQDGCAGVGRWRRGIGRAASEDVVDGGGVCVRLFSRVNAAGGHANDDDDGQLLELRGFSRASADADSHSNAQLSALNVSNHTGADIQAR